MVILPVPAVAPALNVVLLPGQIEFATKLGLAVGLVFTFTVISNLEALSVHAPVKVWVA